MEVPLRTSLSVLLAMPTLSTSTPGAKMSTSAPKLLKSAIWSLVWSMAPTVMALGAEAGLTFADYMGMDNYFRRQAARQAGLSQTTMKLVRGALDLIFGFLPMELKGWLDAALAKDSTYVFELRVLSLLAEHCPGKLLACRSS